MDLFEYNARQNMAGDAPLADRMRPRTLEDFIGQGEAVGEGSLIRQAIATQRLFSMILWGPPGCGKTTLARLIARASQARFVEFSAVLNATTTTGGRFCSWMKSIGSTKHSRMPFCTTWKPV